ncbi:hypothetical protein ACFV3R_25770 [Streptomyces sp. NPDC059740]|uniref:hypothetical protein n=1 Tax=Streptomyces sp. NPDC059740 TaxID=3346926 RepID=UPI00365309D1
MTRASRDATALAADVAHAGRLGFTGKLCVHPRQLQEVAAGFAPTEDELRWARTVLAAGDSVSVVEGRMVDRRVQERARRILAATGAPEAER